MMDNQTALNILEQAMEVANKGGAFTIKDAATIHAALRVIQAVVLPVDEPVTDRPIEKPKAKK